MVFDPYLFDQVSEMLVEARSCPRFVLALSRRRGWSVDYAAEVCVGWERDGALVVRVDGDAESYDLGCGA